MCGKVREFDNDWRVANLNCQQLLSFIPAVVCAIVTLKYKATWLDLLNIQFTYLFVLHWRITAIHWNWQL